MRLPAGKAYERSVVSVAKFLAEEWSFGRLPKIHIVDFSNLVPHLKEKIEPTNYWNYINLSTISKGLYTITVSSEDHQIIRKKLVKL